MVLSAMRGHPAAKACWTLWSLAVNNDNKVKVASAGGIEMVLAAMGDHPDVAAAGLLGIVESCC